MCFSRASWGIFLNIFFAFDTVSVNLLFPVSLKSLNHLTPLSTRPSFNVVLNQMELGFLGMLR